MNVGWIQSNFDENSHLLEAEVIGADGCIFACQIVSMHGLREGTVPSSPRCSIQVYDYIKSI